LFGEDPQVKALRAAGRIEEAQRLEAQKFQEFIISQTAGQREAGQEAISQLQEEVAAPIGESPLFQRGLRAGQAGLHQGLGRLGLADSSVGALAQGELAANLTAGEVSRRQNILSGLAQGAGAGLGAGLGALQLQSGLASRLAQTQAGIGGAQAAGRQAMFGNLLQLGLLGQLSQQPQASGGTLGVKAAQFGGQDDFFSELQGGKTRARSI
jgi:hypothetical protein